jgi:hypothetical protein
MRSFWEGFDMDFSDKIARYEEIERRGLLSQLPQEKQDMWAEYKRRQAKDSTVNNDTKNDGKQSYLEQMAGKVATLDRGLTFGLGRKALGAAWASGAKLGDTLAGNDNAPDFWGRYHEFVDPVVEAQQQYAEEHPAEALTAEIAASIANPANKVGASYIGKGKSLADVAARASAVGGGIGGVAGAMNTEYAKDLFPNTAAGVGVGAAMGGILPVAANRAGAVYNAIKRITAPEASVAGKATGLGNIVKDNESVRALSRGIMADDAVAAQVLQEAPTEMGRLNEELTDILNKTTGRKLNIEGAKQNADEAYKSYVAANADYPVYNTKTPQEQAADNFARWFEGSQVVDENGQPLKLYHGTRANFDTFDLGKSGQSNGGISKIGVWMTPEEQIAKEFSNTWYGGDNPRVMQMYVDMKNPKVYKSVDNTKALKKIESDIDNVNNKMQKINSKLSNSELSQLRGFMQYDDYDEIAKMYGYSPETAKNAKDYWNLDKQLDDLLFEQRNLKANDAYDQLLNDLDEYSEFVMHTDGVKDFRRGSHTSRIAIKNPDEAVAKLKDRLKKEGYDGIIVENTNRDTDVIGKNASQYVAFEPNQIKSVNNSGAWSSSPSLSDAGWKPQPSLKDVVGQLNEYKQNAMNKALAEGAAMSDYGAGSLDAVHKAQGVLNDMINASYDTTNPLKPKATTKTAELMSLKQVFNNLLEPSGVKPLDARIAKAKSLEYFRDMGYKFKPSEKKFEDLGIKTLRDKRAFLQGRLQAILDNVKDDKNLAKAIRADENTLKKLMPAKRFDELLSKTSEIDRQYTRLNKYIQLANRELDKPLAADRPMSERGETWSSYLSSLYDKANARMWQNANSRRAQALLNGGAQNPEVWAALERLAGRYNLGQITPYIAQLAAQNQ